MSNVILPEEWHVDFLNANVGGVNGNRAVFDNIDDAQTWIAANQEQAGVCTLSRVSKSMWAIYGNGMMPTPIAKGSLPAAANVTHTKFGGNGN